MSQTKPHARQYWLFDLSILTCLMLLFYFFKLNHYPLFTPDEARYSEVAREMIVSHDYLTPRLNGVAFLDKPILYYWLQAAAIYLFGVKEWALRLFPILISVVGCLATYTSSRLLFNRRTALLAAAILATCPIYFANAHYADLNLEVAVFISCSLLFFLVGFEKNSRLFMFAAYASAALAFLTKGLIGLAFPCLIIFCWLTLAKRWRHFNKLFVVSGLIIFLLITSPWYVAVQLANPGFFKYFFLNQQVARFLSHGRFNNPISFWFYLPIILIGIFPWTIFIFQTTWQNIKKLRNPSRHPLVLFLCLWVGIVFIFFSIPHSKPIGYILPLVPAIAILIAQFLDSIWLKTCNHYATVIGLSLCCLTLVAISWLGLNDWAGNINHHLFLYLYIIDAILIFASIVMPFYLVRKQLAVLVYFCIAFNMLWLSVFMLSTPYLSQDSNKTLVTYLKTIIKPQDEVVNYFRFFQDVPIYLGKKVTIVADWQSPTIPFKDNWTRELWYGMPFQDTSNWLIDEKTFWQRFNSKNRLFVFVSKNYFDQFKQHAAYFYVLKKQNDVFLISNQPTSHQILP